MEIAGLIMGLVVSGMLAAAYTLCGILMVRMKREQPVKLLSPRLLYVATGSNLFSCLSLCFVICVSSLVGSWQQTVQASAAAMVVSEMLCTPLTHSAFISRLIIYYLVHKEEEERESQWIQPGSYLKVLGVFSGFLLIVTLSFLFAIGVAAPSGSVPTSVLFWANAFTMSINFAGCWTYGRMVLKIGVLRIPYPSTLELAPMVIVWSAGFAVAQALMLAVRYSASPSSAHAAIMFLLAAITLLLRNLYTFAVSILHPMLLQNQIVIPYGETRACCRSLDLVLITELPLRYFLKYIRDTEGVKNILQLFIAIRLYQSLDSLEDRCELSQRIREEYLQRGNELQYFEVPLEVVRQVRQSSEGDPHLFDSLIVHVLSELHQRFAAFRKSLTYSSLLAALRRREQVYAKLVEAELI